MSHSHHHSEDHLHETKEGRALILATKSYAVENRFHSWWSFLSTLALFTGTMTGTVLPWAWPLRLLCSVVSALLLVRLFVIYHDHQHHAILDRSKMADWMMRGVGMLVLAPSSVWKHCHNTHHAHNSKLHGNHLGTFPVMTRERFQQAGPGERFLYLTIRHPLTIMGGYLSAFLYAMCLQPFFENPRRHFDGLLSVILHLALGIAFWMIAGWSGLVLGLLIPYGVAAGLGSYLFYAQHNFPGVQLKDEDGWTYEGAALESSSYLKMPRIMHWFTGNIGYHHIHHLNAKIPFYRLPEAYRAMPELQTPKTTSLHPKDVLRCLRLKVWDVEKQRMVPLKD